jgi:hypothetical protein
LWFLWLTKSIQTYAKPSHSLRSSRSNLQKFRKNQTGALLNQAKAPHLWPNLQSMWHKRLPRSKPNHMQATRIGIRLDKTSTKSLIKRSQRETEH